MVFENLSNAEIGDSVFVEKKRVTKKFNNQDIKAFVDNDLNIF